MNYASVLRLTSLVLLWISLLFVCLKIVLVLKF